MDYVGRGGHRPEHVGLPPKNVTQAGVPSTAHARRAGVSRSAWVNVCGCQGQPQCESSVILLHRPLRLAGGSIRERVSRSVWGQRVWVRFDSTHARGERKCERATERTTEEGRKQEEQQERASSGGGQRRRVSCRREFCHCAAPPSPLSRCLNRTGEGISVK